MLKIYKVYNHPVLDFAAEELKKYMRMMMPEEGEIMISYNPEAEDGFRLGLLENFCLPDEAEDAFFDDVIHIDTTEECGIFAGSNPRSVLFAVYRFLKLNGCRFLFPGVDGEYIPRKKITPQCYHKLADYRFRGHTLEGAPSTEQVLQYIDFHAKSEQNAFGLYAVFIYQRHFYRHVFNDNRPEEGFDPTVAEEQWRALYECEIKKRGMLLFSGEHEWITKALGLKLGERYLYKHGEKQIPEEIRPYLAQLKGERKLFMNDPLYTNVCMSNPKVRTMLADEVVKAAEEGRHLDYLGFTVGDCSHNHCECDACTRKRPSDWYVMILNEIDEKLTAKGLPTRISIVFYVDMMFAPLEERLNNPSRFLLVYAPITRSYTAGYSAAPRDQEPIPFIHNRWQPPKTSDQLATLFRQWQVVFPGPYSVFEYHFWKTQYRDLGHIAFARRVYEDAIGFRRIKADGCMQDGSNKSFWPNGFSNHIYAETMMNTSLDYDAEMADYYSHLYGEDWKEVVRYLTGITEAFDFEYMLGEKSLDTEKGLHYNPDRIEPLSTVKELSEQIRRLAKNHLMDTVRPQSVAWRLLERHGEFCEGFADVMIEKCQGNTKLAMEMNERFFHAFFTKYDYEIERFCDPHLAYLSLHQIVKNMPALEVINAL